MRTIHLKLGIFFPFVQLIILFVGLSRPDNHSPRQGGVTLLPLSSGDKSFGAYDRLQPPVQKRASELRESLMETL